MSSLFPEPSTADKLASVDHLRRDAQDKAHTARRARDPEAANFWLNEMVRLDRIRQNVLQSSQQELTL